MKSARLASIFALLLSALVGQASSAHAQTATELIDRGVSLRERGSDAEALALFAQAAATGGGARATAQMGLAEQALGRWIVAEQHLLEALRQSEDAWIVRAHEVLASSLLQVQQRLGTIALEGGLPNAEIVLDGVSVGRLPLVTPLRVVAGRVVVEIRAAGYVDFLREVIVPAGGAAREVVTLVARPAARQAEPIVATRTPVAVATPPTRPSLPPVAAVPPAAVPPAAVAADSGSGSARPLGVAALVIGGVGIAVGVVGSILRARAISDYGSPSCLAVDMPRIDVCPDARERIDSATLIMAVGFISGAVLGGLGLTLFAIGGEDDAPADSAAMACSFTGSGVACRGRF